MKIVIATPIVYDQSSPFNHLFKDIIGGFLEDGDHVVRLAAVENIDDTDFKYGYTKGNISYRLYKRKKSSHDNIISRYIRDNLTGLREAIGILKEKNVDVLFEDVCYASVWPVLAAKIKGIKVVAMLQDVWPDNAVQSHLISEDSIIYMYFEMWQRYVYKHADQIICISDDMKDFIASKGVDEKKIDVIYNWGYSDEVVDIAWEDNEFVRKYNLDKNRFYAVYAGNIGKMQNVEIVVNAAKELQHRDDIHFLIIGDGARKEAIEEMAKGMKNVTMLPMQPSEIATHIYSAAGVNIIPLVAGGTKTALPSKTGVVLSCGRPAIFTFGNNTYFAKLLKSYCAGESIDPNYYHELAEHIVRYLDEEKTAGKKNLISTLFKEYFTKTNGISRYVQIVKGVKNV